MCITIVTAKKEVLYNTERPLEEQLKGSKKVVIDYDPSDTTLDTFLNEVEKLCKNGTSAKLNISFNHNNHLTGAKRKKEATKLSKDLDINEIIKLMVLAHSSVDKKLEELANYCMDKGTDRE